MTIPEFLNFLKNELRDGGIECFTAEAEIILSEQLKVKRPELFLLTSDKLTPEVIAQSEAIASRRIAGEPLQYIIGHEYFMNICLEVAPGVLIPRPETELMVEKICREASRGAAVCDVGTGSGAIALSIACERPDTKVTAVDISPAALAVARKNLDKYKFPNVELLQSDLFAALKDRKYDYIAANLPYVSPAEYALLPSDVKDYEPESALLAEDNGLAIIKRAALTAPTVLKPGGKIIFEIGEEQGPEMKEFLHGSGLYSEVEIIKDLNRLDRFAYAVLT